ncbi:MAG TPA: amidohydrolase family protein, partial [Acidimicrobiales bacterium]|nr:amidohydrolase family protein [Acidimicrobiales bacterium]
ASPEEAHVAATHGGAKALRRKDVGHLGLGARADLVVLDAPTYLHLAYRPGVPLVAATWKDGVQVWALAGAPGGTDETGDPDAPAMPAEPGVAGEWTGR